MTEQRRKPRELWIYNPEDTDYRDMCLEDPKDPDIEYVHFREVIPFDGFKPEDFHGNRTLAERANAILREKGIIN